LVVDVGGVLISSILFFYCCVLSCLVFGVCVVFL